MPKVIDFGVAKAAGQSLTEKTLVTGLGNIVGTLEYMSPEQAEVNQLDVDTRSDIYSLGVLLYELLVGSPPFTRKDLGKVAGMLEMLRVIREQEPSKPSTKLSTAEGLPTLAANRGTEPAKLTRLVRGELDWIVMKALDKDRNRRYETANGSRDGCASAYLADEPVLACPPSVGYRLRKFARRHKGGLAVAALVLLFLVLLGSGAGWVWRDRAARAAEQANYLERAVEQAESLHPGRQSAWAKPWQPLERPSCWPAKPTPLLPWPSASSHCSNCSMPRDATRSLSLASKRSGAKFKPRWMSRRAGSAMRKGYPKIREALQQYGIGLGVTPVSAAVAYIQKRPATVQSVVLAALDHCLRFALEGDAGTRKWLTDVLQQADSDPWRNNVRRAWKQPVALEALAKDIDVRQQPPSFLVLVAGALPIESPSCLDLKRRVQFAYPGDFWANHELQTSGPGGICVATGLAESPAPTIEYTSRRFVPG